MTAGSGGAGRAGVTSLTCLLTENPMETATKGNLVGKERFQRDE